MEVLGIHLFFILDGCIEYDPSNNLGSVLDDANETMCVQLNGFILTDSVRRITLQVDPDCVNTAEVRILQVFWTFLTPGFCIYFQRRTFTEPSLEPQQLKQRKHFYSFLRQYVSFFVSIAAIVVSIVDFR